MKRNFYVEFIGMPASGKSYYCKKIKKIFQKKKIATNDYNILSKPKKIFFFIFFILKYTTYSIRIFNTFLNLDFYQREVRKHFYYFINEASLRIYHELNKNLVINSEGFRYRSLFNIICHTNKKKKRYISQLINSQPKVHLLIMIKSKKKINLERSKNRKKGYKYSNQEQKMYEKNEKIIMQICEESSKKSSIINITKKNEKKDLKKIVNEIKKFYE